MKNRDKSLKTDRNRFKRSQKGSFSFDSLDQDLPDNLP
jgi:hypothetical protein